MSCTCYEQVDNISVEACMELSFLKRETHIQEHLTNICPKGGCTAPPVAG